MTSPRLIEELHGLVLKQQLTAAEKSRIGELLQEVMACYLKASEHEAGEFLEEEAVVEDFELLMKQGAQAFGQLFPNPEDEMTSIMDVPPEEREAPGGKVIPIEDAPPLQEAAFAPGGNVEETDEDAEPPDESFTPWNALSRKKKREKGEKPDDSE